MIRSLKQLWLEFLAFVLLTIYSYGREIFAFIFLFVFLAATSFAGTVYQYDGGGGPAKFEDYPRVQVYLPSRWVLGREAVLLICPSYANSDWRNGKSCVTATQDSAWVTYDDSRALPSGFKASAFEIRSNGTLIIYLKRR